MKDEFLQKATDPHQYDTDAVDWKKEGLKDSPTRRFFQEYLEQELKVSGKSVVDIGSGMGQLFPLLKKLGAGKVWGIEPSTNNAKVSREMNPDVSVFNGTLEQAATDEKFDVAISVMVFEHVADIGSAFAKIGSLLKPKGMFYLICGDLEYNKTPRFDYQIDTAAIDADTMVTKVKRPLGTLYDIFRTEKSYIEAAERNGFSLEKHVQLKPTETYISLEPRYREFEKTTIAPPVYVLQGIKTKPTFRWASSSLRIPFGPRLASDAIVFFLFRESSGIL